MLDARIKLTWDPDLSTDGETAFKLEFPKAREFFGADAAPMIAYLSTQSGTVAWRRETVKASTRERVKERVAQGMSQADIAKELGVTKGRVSQILKEVKLTPSSAKDV